MLKLKHFVCNSPYCDNEMLFDVTYSYPWNEQVQRNKQSERLQGGPASSSTIQLPFLVVNTSKKTVIDCSISSDKMEYLFTFDDTFEIHDDIEVLKRMGMALGLHKANCSEENLAKV